jgi:glycosyltransferase involved in cell wall biosynthesis
MKKKTNILKLLFLLPTTVFGGAERTSLNLLSRIDRAMFRTCLVTSRNIFNHFEHSNIEKLISIEGLGIDHAFNSFERFKRDVETISSLIGKEKPDVAFGMMHYASYLLVLAKKLYGFQEKVIVSPRGPLTRYLEYFEPDLHKKLLHERLFCFSCKYADSIIVASQGMKEECVDHFCADSARTIVIPNCVDFNDINIRVSESTDMNIPLGFQVICSAARLEREKSISFLLKAFSLVRKQRKVKLAIIGDGSERRNLEKLSHELNIEEDTIFLGFQENPYKFIRKSDIYVHTCLFEGFSNSIIEAMACGVPVISTDCPYGPGEIITNNKNGILVGVDDSNGLIEAINTLLDDRDLRETISLQGLMTSSNYSVERMTRAYETCFCTLADTSVHRNDKDHLYC